ncbi:hypothetical protein ACLS0F_09535, partial [Avibacterium endocarditidis]|uniref:hypothetical protein n=1 Tax=Avibacterium endocarditidis TaxID=380674 RepID=UPI003BF7E126
YWFYFISPILGFILRGLFSLNLILSILIYIFLLSVLYISHFYFSEYTYFYHLFNIKDVLREYIRKIWQNYTALLREALASDK